MCQHMAKGEPKASIKKKLKWLESVGANWDNEYCAEHDGSIASFQRLSLRISDLADYRQLFKRDVVDLSKVGKYAGYTAAGVVAMGAIVATSGSGAPAVAAAIGEMGLLGAAGTGTTISTLSGAALTSASLAAIGGSVAAGTVVVSAVGVGLGGLAGGALAHQYHRDDPTFGIRKLKKSNGHNVVFINGFTQEREQTFKDWTSAHSQLFPDEQLYGVNWSSKTLYDLGTIVAAGGSKSALKAVLTKAALHASKQAGKKIGPYAMLALLTELGGNPWHVAMANSARTGAMVADSIVRSKQETFTLVGHSLGARVIYYTLQALATRSDAKIQDVILLGAAVGRDDDAGWKAAQRAIKGSIYNCYSSNDGVLRYLYQFLNLKFSDPAGLRPITYRGRKIKNIDCGDHVKSHMEWKNHYREILGMIY